MLSKTLVNPLKNKRKERKNRYFENVYAKQDIRHMG